MALSFPFSKATLLGALLRNESGGRNIANTRQGTSSGQAQGYFQITTGTWNDFGGRKYASSPLGATYAQQADIASKIPLKRWDNSTLAAMRGTGRPINPNRTLGENLQMHGESFGGAPTAATASAPVGDVGGIGRGSIMRAQQAQQAGVPDGNTPASNVPPLFATELTGADKTKPLGGLLGQMAAGGDLQMPEMPAFQTGAGGGGGGDTLATMIQQYLASSMRGGPKPLSQQPGGSRLG